MFINPKIAIEKGWIKHPKCKNLDDWSQHKFISPNAIDFTLDKVMTLNTDTMPFVGETYKNMRTLYLLDRDVHYTDSWLLEGLRVYDGMSNVYVEVPEGVAAVLYTRSTFTRNGVFITSGLYDQGFKGNVGFTIYTIGGPICVEGGARIGQIVFVKSEDSGILYAGGYNHPEGTHYTEQVRQQPTEKSEQAKVLEETNKWDSDQRGPVAGTKSFV